MSAVMGNEALAALFDDYAEYHRHPLNELRRDLWIPLIVFTLVGLLHLWSLAPALVVAGAALLYQVRLSPVLTLLFGAFVGLSFLGAHRLAPALLWGGFVGGWVLRLVGHYAFEKKSPAFFNNLQQLLVGPLWILGTLGAKPSSPTEALDSSPPEGASRTP